MNTVSGARLSAGVPLKCPSRQWCIALPGATGAIDVLCREKYCRTATGGAVRHVFDLATGSFQTFVVEPIAAHGGDREQPSDARVVSRCGEEARR